MVENIPRCTIANVLANKFAVKVRADAGHLIQWGVITWHCNFYKEAL